MAGFTPFSDMRDPTYLELLETSWRRPLTEAESARLQALLAADPAAAADWRAHEALGRLLRRLPEPALSSNFTAQVLRAVEAKASQERGWAWSAWYRRWAGSLWPRLAWAAALALLATATLQGYRRLDRTWLVRDLAKLPAVTALPSPEVLRDFDAIRQLSLVAPPAKDTAAISDDDLLKALQ
jgi:hypothetical protein